MLESACLKYSLEKNGLVKDSFILSQCTMRSCSDDPLRLDIDVLGRGLMCLRTDTPAEKHRWYVAFKKAQKILFQAYQKRVLTPSGVYNIGGLPASYSKRDDETPVSDRQSIDALKLSNSIETLRSTSIGACDESRMIILNADDCVDHGESKSVDVADLFVKTKVGQEPQSALNCILSNTTCLDEITKKIIEELRASLTGDAKKKVETLSLITKEYCASIQQLYLEEVRARKDLEQSLFRMTRRNMKLEQQDLQKTPSDQDRQLGSFDSQMHVSNKYHELVSDDSDSSDSVYCGHMEEEFFECEDFVQRSAVSAQMAEVATEYQEKLAINDTKEELPAQEENETEAQPIMTVETPAADAIHAPVPALSKEADVVIQRRVRLPHPHSELKVSIWSMLKDMIGKDLSRISMPICLNEPTTALQRSCEDFEYCDLLKTASEQENSVDRLAYVTVFSITPYQSAVGRTYKPFNPLLGETYEFTHRGFKFLAEQVGHHPPICAFHCHNEHFESYGSTNALVKLTGKSVEVSIIGPFIVDLLVQGEKETYKLQRCYVVVHNIIFGKMWIEVVGTAIIRNVSGGEFSVVQYLRKGWFDKEMHKVRSLVFDGFGTPKYYISGKWSEVVYMEQVRAARKPHQKKMLLPDGCLDYDTSLYKNEEDAWDAFVNEIDWDKLDIIPGTKREMWRPNKRPHYHEQYYGFGYMTMELNDLSPDYDPKKGAAIPPTDSRFRPDLRAYENGNMDLATMEKTRLEERQREAAKKRIDGEKSYQSLWFDKKFDSNTRQPSWDFKGTYWQKKADGTIADNISDIYSH